MSSDILYLMCLILLYIRYRYYLPQSLILPLSPKEEPLLYPFIILYYYFILLLYAYLPLYFILRWIVISSILAYITCLNIFFPLQVSVCRYLSSYIYVGHNLVFPISVSSQRRCISYRAMFNIF